MAASGPRPEDETVDLGRPADHTEVLAPRAQARTVPLRRRRPQATTVAAAVFALAALALFLLLVTFELGKAG